MMLLAAIQTETLVAWLEFLKIVMVVLWVIVIMVEVTTGRILDRKARFTYSRQGAPVLYYSTLGLQIFIATVFLIADHYYIHPWMTGL